MRSSAASRTASRPITRARAGVGLQQRGQDPHRGGLAGAVRAEQAEDGAGARGEVHAAQRLHRPVGLLEPLDDDRVIVMSELASDSEPMVRLSHAALRCDAWVTGRGVGQRTAKTSLREAFLATSRHRAGSAGVSRPGRSRASAGRAARRSSKSASSVESYWTADRMQAAEPAEQVVGGRCAGQGRAAAVDLTGGHDAVHAAADLHARQGVLHARRQRLRLLRARRC